MKPSDQLDIVTLVANPPAGSDGARDPFITAALQTLAGKKLTRNRVIKIASVQDVDLELSEIFAARGARTLHVQIIGHNLSGGLALGACWIAASELYAKAFRFPHYVLDTNPAALGLLSKHAGKLSELMLVGCQIGSAAVLGHAINGRTLTYTLAELLRCDVMGADDVIGPDEFDDRGWYTPSAQRRRPKGWRWSSSAPPTWVESAAEPAPRRRTRVA